MADSGQGGAFEARVGRDRLEHALGLKLIDAWAAQRAWSRRGWLFIFGLASGLSFAPIYFLPGWVLGLAALLWLQRRSPTRRAAFLDAWVWSIGHFVPGIYWIASSFLIDAARFGWMAPPVIGALGAYLAIYPALAAVAAWHARRHPWAQAFVLAGAWTCMEWARGQVLTGFPWNLAAYIWAFAQPMMQSAAIWGAWGLSLATVLATGFLSIAMSRRARTAVAPMAAALAILCGLYLHGLWRLTEPEPADTQATVRLVQANIAQWDKLTGRDREGQIRKHLDLSVSPNQGNPTAIIWPETAATVFLDREAEWRRALGGILPQDGLLITGALRGEPVDGPPERYWNALYVLGRDGQTIATYDKFHLVPLGEYVPFRDFFPFIGKLTGGGGNFSEGSGPVTIHPPGLPSFSPLICYEIIFPNNVLDPDDRPDFLLNVTNDGWFGQTSGPHQHFASARFRTVETGLPLVRAANSGISAIVDSRGKVVDSSALGQVEVIDGLLPGASAPTIFQRLGLLPAASLAIICLIFGAGLSTWTRAIPDHRDPII